MLDPEGRAIKVLQNPSAPVSSQEMHWQDIKLPCEPIYVSIPPYCAAFAPLNSTEIAIAGGEKKNYYVVGDFLTFDTTTCELKNEFVNKLPFKCSYNKSTNFCDNTIIALVYNDGSYHVLKYTKGDTSATILFTF